MLPAPTSRLRFREMTEADIDLMAGLLGDPAVMRFYPRPKTRDEAMCWIGWSQASYAQYGYGLWIIETHAGDFVGDCGLTWQPVGDSRALEVGYHTVPVRQCCGYATEAAQACLELATGPIGESHVVAIINPANTPSRRVAEKARNAGRAGHRVSRPPSCGVRATWRRIPIGVRTPAHVQACNVDGRPSSHSEQRGRETPLGPSRRRRLVSLRAAALP